MRIGLDLDGTIVVFDQIFHQQAQTLFGMPAEIPPRKESVRDWVRRLPDGEQRWIELQGLVYGPMMEHAPPAPGVLDFLQRCRDAELELSVVSHRTRASVSDPRIDLHAAARDWLDRWVVEARVFLEPTRAAKLTRIRSEGCGLFVDDLPEVFAEPDFPDAVERWLYAPGRSERPGAEDGEVRTFSDWSRVLERALELRPDGA